jgi:hypothetical protein
MNAADARRKIESLIAELNADCDDGRIVIAWGTEGGDDENGALLSFAGRDMKEAWDVNVSLIDVGGDQNPEIIVELAAKLDMPTELPQQNTRRLFNLLEAMWPGIQMHLHPVRPDRNSTLPTIEVVGVETQRLVESLTSENLDRAINFLLASANAAGRILNGVAEKQDDAWGRMTRRKPDDPSGD